MSAPEEQLSNTDTAVGAPQLEKGGIDSGTPAYEPDGSVVFPPRTGFLRINWYKRYGNWRPYPASCSAGLALIATTTFAVGLILCHANGVKNVSVLSGSLFFSSGLIQIITGIWAIVDNNLFGSVLLLDYGAFFMSYGGIVTDAFNVSASYDSTEDFNNAFGIFLASWTVFDFFLMCATFKSTVPLVLLTFFKWFFMLLYTIAIFGEHSGVRTASGVFAFLCSISAFYGVYDGLMSAETSYAPIPESKFLRMPGAYKKPVSDRVAIV